MLGYACSQELSEKPTTLQEDEAALQAAATDIEWRYWSALQLRMGHKRLLHHCASQADAALLFLQIQELLSGHDGSGAPAMSSTSAPGDSVGSPDVHAEL